MAQYELDGIVRDPRADAMLWHPDGLRLFLPQLTKRIGMHPVGEVIVQPYVPRALLGRSRLGWLMMRALTTVWPRDRWAARIDLVARKRPSGNGDRGL